MKAFTTIDGQKITDLPDYVDDEKLLFSENSKKVLEKRYVRRGVDGEALETPAGMFYRLAWVVGEVWRNSPDGQKIHEFYNLMAERRFFPNSPTFTGAGTPLGQLAACFVLPIIDDMGKEEGGIFDTLKNAALIQQTGGGNGFSFSSLRPKGDLVASSGGTATGPIGFLQAYDSAFGIVQQGGARRGANMAVLRVDHPDIEEFITCKAEEGKVANFNISVGITDKFMEAVIADQPFQLINPRNGGARTIVKARNLFHKIVHYAHKNGEPGVLFLDAANRSNPVPHLYDLEATNPCGEQWLGPYENCCLGSVNLATMIDVTPDGSCWVDWDLLEKTVREATDFLDCVVTANKYVPAVPELREAALRCRRIGLGIMGLADLMYMVGIRYGSEEGQEFAAQIMEFVHYHTMDRSIELAIYYGPFPAIENSIYDFTGTAEHFWEAPKPIKPYTRNWLRPKLNWTGIGAGIMAYGIRNAAHTTIAPTGTIATVCGCEGYGCEPVFGLGYIRHFKDGDKDVELVYTSPLFEEALSSYRMSEEDKDKIKSYVAETGTCQDLPLPDHIRNTFVVSSDITAEEHVMMQAAMQAFVSNSISKTCNFPEGATEEDVAEAYMLAWKTGCKGLTVYVTGSREQVVLETLETKATKGSKQEEVKPTVAEKVARPSKLTGATYKKETPIGTAYITVNSDDSNNPFEVFLNVGKAGSEVSAVSEALGRLISLVLRLPSSATQIDRVNDVIEELIGIGGGRHIGFGRKRVRSLPDGIAQVLTEHINGQIEIVEEKTPAVNFVTGEICPDCGEATLLFLEGCNKCSSCGYSEC